MKSAIFLSFFSVAWWFFWLALPFTNLISMSKISYLTYLFYFVFLFSFLLGCFMSIHNQHYAIKNLYYLANQNTQFKDKKEKFFTLIIIILLLFVFYALYKSGFFLMTYDSYHAYVRGREIEGYLTNLKYLDLGLKIVIYPFIVTFVILGFVGILRKVNFFLSVIVLIIFSILYQVSYPFIMLFWFFIFQISFLFLNKKGHYNKKIKIKSYLFLIFTVLSVIVYNASLRYGEFSWGILEYYFINYHILGFNIFDVNLNNPGSLLHNHSFGRSSLGFIEQAFDFIVSLLGVSYQAASLQNLDYNMLHVTIGPDMYANAFGTFLFSFYRDFHVFGIILGGLLYGYFLIKMYLRSFFSWRSKAIFFTLAYGWFTGMMVSPIEQGYFWFSILFFSLYLRIRV